MNALPRAILVLALALPLSVTVTALLVMPGVLSEKREASSYQRRNEVNATFLLRPTISRDSAACPPNSPAHCPLVFSDYSAGCVADTNGSTAGLKAP